MYTDIQCSKLLTSFYNERTAQRISQVLQNIFMDILQLWKWKGFAICQDWQSFLPMDLRNVYFKLLHFIVKLKKRIKFMQAWPIKDKTLKHKKHPEWHKTKFPLLVFSQKPLAEQFLKATSSITSTMHQCSFLLFYGTIGRESLPEIVLAINKVLEML